LRRALLVVDVLLLVLSAYLAVQVGHAWQARGLVGPAAPARPAAPEPAPVTPSSTVAAATPAPAVIAERNLFSPSRSETPPEPRRTVAPPAPPPPRPRLYGIVILPDGRSRAFIEDAQRRRVFGYSVGEAVAGSRVERIEADRVVLSRGSETYEVLLRDPNKPKPRPSPGVPAAPGRALPPGMVPGVPPAALVPGNPALEDSAEGSGGPRSPRLPSRAGRFPPGTRPTPSQPLPAGSAVPVSPGAMAPPPPAPPAADEDDDP
jgi:hypothetical protein